MNNDLKTGLQFTGFGTHLKVRDIEKSREFYEDTLGLVPSFAYGDEAFLATVPSGTPSAPERYRGVTYEVTPNALLEIADGHIAVTDEQAFSSEIQSPKVSALVKVESLLPLLQAGIRPTFPVRHYYWGTIEIALRDPDGWVLVFAAPYSEQEERAVSSLVSVEKVDA